MRKRTELEEGMQMSFYENKLIDIITTLRINNEMKMSIDINKCF